LGCSRVESQQHERDHDRDKGHDFFQHAFQLLCTKECQQHERDHDRNNGQHGFQPLCTKRRDGGKGGSIVRVDDEPRHLVGLLGDQRLVQNGLERQIGQRQLGGAFSSALVVAMPANLSPARQADAFASTSASEPKA
jgi:hypothetical protein